MPHVYSLTRLTGARRNEDRRAVVFTVEVRRYTLFVVAASVLISAVPTLVASFLIGPFALFVPAISIVAGLLLWDTRQRNGMKLRNYQAILDRRKARNGVLYASGTPIPKPELVMHQMVVVPARAGSPDPALPAPVPTRRGRRHAPAKGLLDA